MMNLKKTHCLLLLLVVTSFMQKIMAQCANSNCGPELITNGDFEIPTAACNIADIQLYTNQTPVQGWYGTSSTSFVSSTPDFFYPGCGGTYTFSCQSGVGFTGVFVKAVGANSREYIQAQLSTPLVAGHSYCFSMTVRAKASTSGASVYGSDGIGAWFHNMGLIDSQTMNGGQQYLGAGSIINATPQIENPMGAIIGTTCVTISGQFCAAGGESWVTIGNFRNDANTTLNPGVTSSYLFIDNVSLKESCSTTLTASVAATPSVICSGACTTLSASISGTTAGTSFTWQPGGQTTATINVCPTNTTTYSLLVNSPGLCLAPQSFSTSTTVSVVPNVTVTTTPSVTTVCLGDAILLTANGGTSYTWSPNSSLVSVSGASAIAMPTVNTTYTVVASNGICSDSATVNVNIASALPITVNSVSLCSGSSATLTASGATNYTWSPSATLNSANGTSVIATPTVNTIYTIVGASGTCTGTTTAVVAYNITPTIAVNSGSICSGNLIVLNASGAVTYSWSNGATTSSISVSPTTTTNYTVIGIDNSCMNISTATVVVEPTPTLNISADTTIIIESYATLNATGNGTQYEWTPSLGIACSNCASIVVSPPVTTQYCVSTAINSCSTTACVLVEVELPCYSNSDYSTATAFTPNGDGINDVFCLSGWEYCTSSFNMVIYNRWGEKVFETDDVTFCWDGYYLGQPLDAAVFVFYIKAEIIKVGTVTKKGNITIIK